MRLAAIALVLIVDISVGAEQGKANSTGTTTKNTQAPAAPTTLAQIDQSTAGPSQSKTSTDPKQPEPLWPKFRDRLIDPVTWFTGFLLVVSFFQWRAMQRQADLTGDTIKLTQAAFVLTNRPKILIRNIDVPGLRPDGASRLQGTLWATNVGFSRARIIRFHARWLFVERLPMTNPELTVPPEEAKKNIKLSAGRTWPLDLPDHKIHAMEHFAIHGGGAVKNELYLVGIVKYRDELNNLRRTMFCRRWNRQTGRFDAVNDPDYEYAD